MKKNLLLLFACLFGALSGVKAWTSVAPGDVRAYYLYNVGKGTYWYGADHNIGSGNTRYTGHTSSLYDATPTRVRISSGNYTFTYYVNGVEYQIRHTDNNGEAVLTGGNANFQLYDKTDGYSIEFKSDKQRRMRAEDAGTCDYPKDLDNNTVHWRFYAYEEILPTLVEHNAPTCASTAASIVSGWERVTTKDQLAQNPERYFYAIFSAVNPGVMMTTENKNDAYRMCYKAAGNPLSSSSYDLFEMENYDGEFAIKSNITGKYYGNTSEAPWNFIADQDALNEDCKVTVTCSNGVYNLQDKYDKGQDEFVGNYLGAWDNMEFVGERLAGNKSIKRAGYFLIYRKLKKNVDMTGLITNPSFETGDLTGWNAPGRNDTGAKENSDNTYKISNGDAVDRDWLFNSWGGTEENSVSQTISLPKGTYRLSALLAGFNGETLTLSAGGQSSNVVVAGDKTYGYTVSVTFTLTETSNVTIKASNKKSQQASDASFIKADNFRLTYLGEPATDDDYTALQNAINNAEGKILGFDNGEYAPYNNVAVLNALADANAIDPSADNLQIDVQNATAAIANENWTVNSGKVNAFYKGDFDGYDEDDQSPLDYTPNGWTATDNFRLMLKNSTKYPGLADASATAAVMVWSGGITYGETEGYTMPLKANTIYKLKFKAAGWNNEDRSGMIVSVLNSGDGLAATDLGTPNRDIKGNETNVPGMTSFERLFRTGAAGNYLFHIQSGHNIVATDFELMTVPSTVPATIGENGYTTFASTYPLDLTQANLPVGVKAYKATSINSSYVHFEKLNQVVPANTGVLLEGGVGVKNIRVAPEDEVAEVTDNLFLVNESNGVFPSEANTTYYAMVKNSDPMTFGKFDPSKVAVPFYKAYLKVNGGSQARLTVMFDGEDPTAINAIEAAEAEDGALKDGKYLIDGKIVIVKNGVKYSANGQKLN